MDCVVPYQGIWKREWSRTWKMRVVLSLIALLGGTDLVGCSWARHQLSQRAEDCEALCLQARAARERGQDDQARRLVDEAIRRGPTDTESKAALAEALWSDGRRDAALNQLGQVLAENPGDVRLACQRAEWLQSVGQTEAAWQAAVEALSQDPAQPTALRVKARCELAQGKQEEALSTLHRLAQANPDDVSAALELAELQLARGAGTRAAPILRDILQRPWLTCEQRDQADWLLGRSYMVSERWDEAEDQLSRVIDRRPPAAGDWYLLAEACHQSGNLASSERALQKALELDPDHRASRQLAAALQQESTRELREAVLPASFHKPSIIQ